MCDLSARNGCRPENNRFDKTFNVSAMGTARRITANVRSRVPEVFSIEISRTEAVIKYPSIKEPESPKKILAGYALYFRNPIKQPVNEDKRTNRKTFMKFKLKKKSKTAINKEIPEASPSKPSSRLKELIVPTINNTKRIIAGIIDISKPKNLTSEIFGIRCISIQAAANPWYRNFNNHPAPRRSSKVPTAIIIIPPKIKNFTEFISA